MKTVLTILIISLFANFSYAKPHSRLSYSVKKISKSELNKTFKRGGLEPVIKDLYVASMQIGAKYIKKHKNKNGQKITDKEGRKALIKVIEAVDHITQKMEPGDLHYYGPAKLYKNFRVDVNLAIERARIPADSKGLIRSALPNSY